MSITEIISPDRLVGAAPRRRLPTALPPLPAVIPGQLWLVELAVSGVMPVPARHAVDAANVVVYDRALGDAVAGALPLGGYAEPALGAEPAAARVVRFARDGWSVARVLLADRVPRERTRHVQDVVDELAAAKVSGWLPVTILAEDARGIEERLEVGFDNLAAVVARYPRDTRLTIVIDAAPGGGVVGLRAVAANGLAG